MDAHGVEVFDAADDDAVIRAVPHDLEFVFFPARDGSFDEDLGDRAGGQTSGSHVDKIVGVGGHAGSGPAQDVRGANDERVADAVAHLERFVERVGKTGFGHGEADLGHGPLEALAVLGGGNRLGGRADHLHTKTLKGSPLVERHGQIEGGLPPEGRQYRIGSLARHNGLQHLDSQRFDIGAVGERRVGHDRGRVGVGQDDPVALLHEDPARLGAGIIELTRLADHDRPTADHQDAVQVVSPGHGLARHPSPSRSGTLQTGSRRRAGRGRPRGGTGRQTPGCPGRRAPR